MYVWFLFEFRISLSSSSQVAPAFFLPLHFFCIVNFLASIFFLSFYTVTRIECYDDIDDDLKNRQMKLLHKKACLSPPPHHRMWESEKSSSRKTAGIQYFFLALCFVVCSACFGVYVTYICTAYIASQHLVLYSWTRIGT